MTEQNQQPPEGSSPEPGSGNNKSRQEDLIRKAVDELVLEGQVFVVSRKDDELEVKDPADSALELRHENPELYGKLLSIDNQFEGRSGFIIGIILLLALGGCAALHIGAFGPGAEILRSIWVYLVIVFLAILLIGFVLGGMEKLVYSRVVRDLRRDLQDADFTRERLLARIAGDKSLERLSEKLKGDHWS